MAFAQQLLAGDHAYYPPPLTIHSTTTQEGLAIFEISGLEFAKDEPTCTIRWKFGDGFEKNQSSSFLVKHHYLKPGSYQVSALPAKACRSHKLATVDVSIPFILKPIGESTLTVQQTSTAGEPVNIDGSANEDSWESAPRFTNFVEFPRGNTAPEVTSVSLMTDEENLYVLFKSRKKVPKLAARQRLRDGEMGSDDRVEVIIDAFSNDDLQSAFTVNALGTQSDDFGGGRANRVEWKGDWQAAVVHTDDTWYTEFAIPIAILPRESSGTDFTINFRRFHHHTRQWSAISGARHESQEKNNRTFKLKIPASIANDAKSQTKHWTLMPYVLAGINTPDREGNLQDAIGYAGVTARYSPVPETTFLLDLFPDFSQLERQFASIDFSYSGNSVDDVRPFFQEGRYYFNLSKKFFNSSNIPNFYGGIKGFTQSGNNSLGSFVTFSPNNRLDSVVRALYKKGNRYTLEAAHIGSIQQNKASQQNQASANEPTTETGIESERKAMTNQSILVKLESSKEFGLNSSFEYGFASNDSGKTIDTGFSVDHETFYRFLDSEVGFELNHYSSSLDPYLGNLDRDLRGTQGGKLYANYFSENDKTLVTNKNYYIEGIYRSENNGSTQRSGFYADVGLTFNHNLYVSQSIYHVDYRPIDTESGSFLTDSYRDFYGALDLDFTHTNENTGAGFYFANGDLGGGSYRYFAPYVWWKPLQSLYLSFSYADLQSFGQSTQFNLDVDYQLTARSSLSFRANRTDGTDYLRTAYRHSIENSIDILATIEDREEEEKTSFAMKLVWTL